MARTLGFARRAFKRLRRSAARRRRPNAVARRVVRRIRRKARRTDPTMGISRGVLVNTKRNTNRITVSRVYTNFAVYTGASIPSTPTIFAPYVGQLMPDFANYVTLFNQYRIKSVTLSFRHTTIEQTDSAAVPNLWAGPWWDYNVGATYTTLDSIINLKGMRRFTIENTGGTDVITYKPKQFKYTVNSLGTPIGCGKMNFPWTDVNFLQLPAYGLAWMITSLPTDQSIAIDVTPTIEFRQTR